MAQQTSSRIGMTPRPFVETASVQEQIEVLARTPGSRPDIPSLNALALRSLVSLFDEEEKLFARCAYLTKGGIQREVPSRKRTIIALLGLHRLAESGEAPPLDVRAIREAILADTSWVKSIGDLGLLIWFTAECDPERLGKLFNNFHFEKVLEAYEDARQACTGGLAWMLAGIAHARLACPGLLPDLTDIAVDTYHLLQDNQSEGGIFGHAASLGFLQQIFCNRMGTFADQMYAIYAFTAFARAFQIEEPLGSALRCANSIRVLQGELGQWWFLYDKRASRVVNRYPLCSLHQNGIAPVALLSLGEATGQSFHEAVYNGLSHVGNVYKVGDELRNLEHGLIWDSIMPKNRISNFGEGALSYLNVSPRPGVENLKILHASRPDHFGWMLYAFGKFGLPRKASAAGARASD
jgi:hypothetical protein